MKPRRQILTAILITCLLPTTHYAEAPVVDESDNFATYQDQAADEQPLARERPRSNRYKYRNDVSNNSYLDEQPLAHEEAPSKSNNASLLSQILSMQKEIQELRGQLEVQGHELQVLKEQQLKFYKDIDDRITNRSAQTPASLNTAKPLSTQTSQPPVQTPDEMTPGHQSTAASASKVITPVGGGTRSNNPAEEQIHYLAAYDLIKTKHFDKAIDAMQSFVTQYPNGGYTANAHYWLGELYMTKKDYNQAIHHFDIVIQQFPGSSKAAPSLLKMAYALAASGKKQEAITHLKQIIKHYPDTHTAKLAEDKLRSLTR